MSEVPFAALTAAAAGWLVPFVPDPLADLARQAAADLRSMADALDPLTAAASATRLTRLVSRFGLSEFDVDVLALGALPHEHEAAATVLGELHPLRLPAIWTGLVTRLLARAAAERLLARDRLVAGPLITAGLLSAGTEPASHRSLSEPVELWRALHGAVEPGTLEPARSGIHDWLAEPEVRRAARLLDRPDVTVLLRTGDPEDGVACAAALAAASGRPARLVDGDRIPVGCVIRDEIPVLRGSAAADPPQAVIAVCAPNAPIDCGHRILVPLDCLPPTPAQREAMWRELLPADPQAARELAGVHRITALQAGRAVGDAAAAGVPISAATVARAIRCRTGQALPDAARLVRPGASWPDIVLPPDQRAVLAAAAERIRDQARVLDGWGLGRRGGAGVRLLFTGPPGTGKTLAAEALAGELGLDLLVVDLAALVSRWLGETEKNLAAVFDAAERSPTVLFFDEADAVFARRTEVGDARDRWANLETSYLLARLERFDGITVLATNLRANIDEAFVRRLEFVVEFAEPGVAERELLWCGHLPPTVPRTPDVQLTDFARLYPITGAVIRNAATAAAFLACADGGAVTRDHLVTAVRREYEKAGRSFPGAPRRAEPLAT